MPNWCFNEANFTNNDPACVDELEAVCRAYAKNDSDPKQLGIFQYLYPMPEEHNEPPSGVGQAGQMPDWWTWRVNNWRTKWEPSAVEIERISPTELWLQFDSAWSPPTGVYERAHENGWSVSATYSESGMGFAGEWNDGIESTWDIEEPLEEEEE